MTEEYIGNTVEDGVQAAVTAEGADGGCRAGALGNKPDLMRTGGGGRRGAREGAVVGGV